MMRVCQLYQVGNSVAMTIPADYRRGLGLKIGDLVYLELHQDKSLVVRSLSEAFEAKRRELKRGAGDVTQVLKHVRVPRDSTRETT